MTWTLLHIFLYFIVSGVGEYSPSISVATVDPFYLVKFSLIKNLSDVKRLKITYGVNIHCVTGSFETVQ